MVKYISWLPLITITASGIWYSSGMAKDILSNKTGIQNNKESISELVKAMKEITKVQHINAIQQTRTQTKLENFIDVSKRDRKEILDSLRRLEK
jgi:hypothetical protein